jgi:hypothetical protein
MVEARDLVPFTQGICCVKIADRHDIIGTPHAAGQQHRQEQQFFHLHSPWSRYQQQCAIDDAADLAAVLHARDGGIEGADKSSR